MPSPLGDFSYTWPFFVVPALGYLLGSIPFGLVLTRFAGLGDIRKIGSGNIGATNVLRTGNKALAALTLLLDGGKGALAVALGSRLGPDMAVLAGGGALVGHLFPVWLAFKGGKGVATGLGVLLGAAFPAGLAACATWLLVAYLFRYSSLAALVTFALSPLYGWLLGDPQIAQLAAFVAILIYVRHAANIRRLLKGEEPKIGTKHGSGH
jgi:glycerol-3-phosphate acyltransferase PlsY